ncbi:MAG TPA: DUF2269 family protein [Candidatus Deferrimicrobiaceae bacterium]|nr:DUF2269 family protein [Candidatus Deferrimicrobiaceae bacterium]
MNLIPWLLFAHVLGAIAAFGASFSALPILGAMGGREPMHGNFAVRASKAVSDRVIIPLAILQGVTGVALILSLELDLLNTGWLLVSIVLYLVALGYALLVQTPAARRMIELTSSGPPPGGPPSGGPPPELVAIATRLRLGGIFLAGLIAIIVFLMVVKPF